MQRFLISTFLLLSACSETTVGDAGELLDAGTVFDDVTLMDTGRLDAEDAPLADTPGMDAPTADAGFDAGLGSDTPADDVGMSTPDAGSDAGSDAGASFASCNISTGFWSGTMVVDPASTEPRDTCPSDWTMRRWFNVLDDATSSACAGLSFCTCTPMPSSPPACVSSTSVSCPPGIPTEVISGTAEARKVSATEILYTSRRTSTRGLCIWTGTLRYTP